jgi:hypothetical protein
MGSRRIGETNLVGIVVTCALLASCVAGDGDHHDVVPQDDGVEDASGPDPHRGPSSPMNGGCGAAGRPAPSLIGAVILSLLP